MWGCMVMHSVLYAQPGRLVSGDVALTVEQPEEGGCRVVFSAYGEEWSGNSLACISTADSVDYSVCYTRCEKKRNAWVLKGELDLSPSTRFCITDTYTARDDGEFELDRTIRVTAAGNTDIKGFSSSFGLALPGAGGLTGNEYFIPGVWYPGNFTKAGNLPPHLPDSSDRFFLYREDRLPLPVVMMRDKQKGMTLTIIHKDSKCETSLNDHKNVPVDPDYRFGGVGIVKRDDENSFAAVVTYPGSDLHRGGMGLRRHPVLSGFAGHAYRVYFKIHRTDSYPQALRTSWELAFRLYDPPVYPVDLKEAYRGLLKTVDRYYMEAPETKAPGFPWSVNLKRFTPDRNTYELGFVGCQPGAGYALFRAGVEQGCTEYREKGEKVLTFWATCSLTGAGLPKTRFAALQGTWDDWAKTTVRQACTGMSSLLDAWRFARRNKIEKPAWLAACRRFGDFLVKNQNEDGSYYMEYDPFVTENGRHPAGNKNKYLTVCAVRYLVDLYSATGEATYKQAAVAAARFCYERIHKPYLYVACVIDNPQTIDSESGQQALNAFLAMYDLTKNREWLDAAEQAAVYEETWCYMFEVPVEKDQTAETDWPRNRSIVGQHLIAIGHSAADLGFAWSSFPYYRLYLLTGKAHYLKIARICAHNTKQSMNLGRKLYPGQPEGLQQEAFQVKVTRHPRREKSVMEALTWNFTAHLDPMLRFLDAFGTCDLEEVEKMPLEKRLRLHERYVRDFTSGYRESK